MEKVWVLDWGMVIPAEDAEMPKLFSTKEAALKQAAIELNRWQNSKTKPAPEDIVREQEVLA